MSNFNIHTKETAQPESAELLAHAEKAYGFIPNLYGVFAESPSALKAYAAISKIFDESSFSVTERQLIALTASRYNECKYCVAAHSVAAEMQKVPADVIDAIREDRPINDSRLEALRIFTTTVEEKRGWLSDEDVSAFLAAGFTRAQILEVILGVTVKTLSSYTNHLADTRLDTAFQAGTWAPAVTRLAG